MVSPTTKLQEALRELLVGASANGSLVAALTAQVNSLVNSTLISAWGSSQQTSLFSSAQLSKAEGDVRF